MTVPFLDLAAAYQELKAEIDAAVGRVLSSGYYILGPEVEAFEREFASYCEAERAVTVGNGLDALIMSLRALGIGSGDEVIVPSNTYIASWLAVSAVGAIPVGVDPNPLTFNIEADKIAEAITGRTRAVMPVHLYGQPADLDPICALAKEHGLFVVEDAAQSHGARYKGQRIGSHGDVVCWSFYPGKNLGAMGDGGAVTTNNPDIADKIALYRNYGSQKKYYHEVKGANSRLDPIQAAILRVKLQYLDDWNARRRQVAKRYLEAIDTSNLVLPFVPNWAEPAWHLFVVQVERRDDVQTELIESGVSTLIHYPVPPHLQQAYEDANISTSAFPVATQMAEKLLSLPIGPHFSEDEQSKVLKDLSFTLEKVFEK